jgi:hypothetical protein
MKFIKTTLFIHNIKQIPLNLNHNAKVRLLTSIIKPIPGPHTTKDNVTENIW